MPKSLVALVGRPNVGKSTLFNRLAGERLAVVDETPGTTRDRLTAEAEWNGVEFVVVDTGGIDPTRVGPGKAAEPLSIGSAEYIPEIRAQAEVAIEDADAVVFITDVTHGVTPADHEVAQILRRHQRVLDGQPQPPVFLAVNKADTEARRQEALAFYELGVGDPYPISALHGQGVGDLLDDLVQSLPEAEAEPEDDAVRVAIVGRPNVGKSSLLNRLLGEERAIVSPIPGTTRDAVDTDMIYDGLPLRLIDTAGVRRRGKIEPGVEKYSVLRTLKAIERSDVALLVVDAVEGVTAQDAHVASFILDAAKSTVIVVNKWDAVPNKDTYSMQAYTQAIRQQLNFLDYVPVLFISAKTGQRVDQVLPTALRIQEERLVRVPTAELNRLVRDAVAGHAPPSKGGQRLKIYYVSQVRTDPPTFVFHVNKPELVHFSYKRYLENRLREQHGFLGTPVRFVFRGREENQ